MAASSDLIAFEILSRLPAKSVFRFKSVCKQWLAQTSKPAFLAAHTRYNPLTISSFIIQHVAKGPFSSMSVEGGASPVLPHHSLSSSDRPFGVDGGFLILQHCNGLLLCRNLSPLPSSTQFLLNPTTMQYRQIPNPPTDPYRFKYMFMLAFDPSTSLRCRIACLSTKITTSASDPTAPRFHVEIYSSDTGAWELSRETVPGGSIVLQGVYWNGALNWVAQNGLIVSFDVEKQVVKTTRLPPRYRRGLMLYLGESGGHLHSIVTVTDVGCGDMNWPRFHVFEMGKDTPSWSLLYNVDLTDVYPDTQGATPDKNALSILSVGVVFPPSLSNWGINASPNFFARGGKGDDDKLYLSDREKILCYNLADRTCREVFAVDSSMHISVDVSWPWAPITIECFPFAHSLFSP